MPASSRSTSILLVAVCTIALLITACGGDEPEPRDGRLHPHSDLIPTYDVEMHPVSKDEANEGSSLSERMNDVTERGDDLQPTGIFVRSAASVEADQLSGDRIVVLDTRHHLLMVYHAEAGRVDTVAVNSEGPEGVAHATGLDVYRDTVYVSSMDYRVRLFDCTAECEYAGITTVDYSVRGVAAHGGQVSLLGFNYDESEENYGMPSRLINRMVGDDVDVQFMDAYASGNPLVDFEMNEGFVARAGAYDVFAFHHMPYLYVFEEEQPVAMFEIEEFYPMEREEGIEPYSISVPTAAMYSGISRVQNYGADELFVAVQTRDRGRRMESLQDVRDMDPDDISVSMDYYLINMATMTPAHVKTMTFGADGRPDVIPTRDYTIVIADGEVKYKSN